MAYSTTDAHQTNAQQEKHHSAARYFVIFALLIVLTAITYWTGNLDLGVFNFPLAMLIATTKAALVVLFFMHLIEHRGTAAMVFVTSVLFVFLLIGLTISDAATRWIRTNPPESQLEVEVPKGIQDQGHRLPVPPPGSH